MPPWWAPLLKLGFTPAYVVLAPFVGALADAVPKAWPMMALYAALLAADMPIQTVLALFGGWVAVVTALRMWRTQRRAVQRRAGNAGG